MSPQPAPAKPKPQVEAATDASSDTGKSLSDRNDPQPCLGLVEAGQAADDTWAVARFDEDEEQGTRMVRINTAMIARRGKRHFAVRLGIAVPGCPWLVDGEDNSEALELEDGIHTYLKQNKAGVLPVVVCETDMREYIVYLAEASAGEALVQHIVKNHSDLELRYYTARDPEWEAYWALADSLGLLDGEPIEGLAHVASC